MPSRENSVRHALVAAVLGVIVGTGLSFVVDAGALADSPLPPQELIRPIAAPAQPTTLIGDLSPVAGLA